jgi:AraC family transcriptional regulator
MMMPAPNIETIDFSQPQTSDALLPQPANLKSVNWDSIHFEHHHQPQFETPEHQGTWHVIAYCPPFEVAGERIGERWLDGKLQTETRNIGDIAIVPAGITQRCNWQTTSEFSIVAIEPTLLQQVGSDWINPDLIELIPRYMNAQDPLIHGVLTALRAEVEYPNKIGGDLLIDSLKTTLAIHLLRNYCTIQPRDPNYQNGLSAVTLKQVKDYIRDRLHQNIKLNDLAAIAHISPYHFLRLFKQSLGTTPHQYILQQRLARSKLLLQNHELTISDIATLVGFEDRSYFDRYFKQVVGITPNQFRRSQ